MDPKGGPIHSLLDDDPAHADAIDDFVLTLSEHVDALQDLEAAGDLLRLAEQAGQLALRSYHVGYVPLQQSAEEVSRAAKQRDPELAYKTLVALTDIAQRVRQGHRGSL